MGFKDADWAYDIALPSVQKVVLVAIAHRTDDKTHQTYVSQKTVAAMVGMAVSTVNKSVGTLESLGILSRQRRSGTGGYRTTDIIVINRSYISHTNVGDTNVGMTHVGNSGRLLPSQAEPTSARRLAEEITQIDHSDGHSVLSIDDEFDEFWIVYPRKQAKADARKAYMAARKTTEAKVILDGVRVYALANIGKSKGYLKMPAGWLRDRRWEDEPVVYEAPNHTPTRGEENLAMVARMRERDHAMPPTRDEALTGMCSVPEHHGYPLPCERCKADERRIA